MAKVMFVENRGKTRFWEAVAERLQHDIQWIVQNPLYSPKSRHSATETLPFPAKKQLAEGEIPDILVTDRGRQYFAAGGLHYQHYLDAVDRALDRLRPDIVFGEATLFHELMVARACEIRGIRYLHPAMSRYPAGRFNVFQGITQNTALGSGDSWEEAALATYVDAIRTGSSLPSYMRAVTGRELKLRALRRYAGHARVTAGWLVGERYNTPSPAHKWQLSSTLRMRLGQWDAIAQDNLPRVDDAILYPMQMQPEANIDVWGRPYSNQLDVVRAILHSSPSDVGVAIKANPKAKYEVNESLLELARSEPRLCLLPRDFSMADARSSTVGTLTVSGTAGLEAVFGLGRCISLRHPILQQEFPEFHADSIDDAVNALLRHPSAGVGNRALGIKLLSRMVSESFEGVISEPLYDPHCMVPENLDHVANALDSVIRA